MHRCDHTVVRETPRRRVLSAAGALLASAGAAFAGGGPNFTMDYRIVARTGQAAPGGDAFTDFGVPSVSADGRVAFQANLDSMTNASGIWMEPTVGGLELGVREGQNVPALVPTTFGEFVSYQHSPIMNAHGDFVFLAPLVADNLNEDTSFGIHRMTDGVLEQLAMPWHPAPGTGALFTDVGSVLALNDSGEIAFYARLGGAGVNDDNDTGVWVGEPGDLELVYREGDAAPGFASIDFGHATGHTVLLNPSGEVAFRNYVQTPQGAEFSVWRGAPGALGMVAISGEPSPAGPDFVFGGYGFGALSLNNALDLTFPQTVEGDVYSGLWIQEGFQPLTAAAYEGWPAPEGYVYKHAEPYGCQLEANGDAVFEAFIDGNGVNLDNDRVIVRRFAGGGGEIIAREGDQAPGLPWGVTLGHAWSSAGLRINGGGAVVHQHKLLGPGVGEDNDYAMFLTTPDGFTRPVIQQGQIMEIGGVERQVDSFSVWSGHGPESGKRAGVSELNQVAMRVTFTDQSEAIIVASPTPACPGDLNNDGVIDSIDLNILLGKFGHFGEAGVEGDIDLDGDVDSIDLNVILAAFGDLCFPV